MTKIILTTAAAVLLYMGVIYLIALARRRNDLADEAWGPGFILAAAVALVAGGHYPPRGLLAAGLVLLWGTRLALHIHARHRGKGEDRRYRKWREEWGPWLPLRAFLQIFMLQGVLLVVVAAPVIYLAAVPSPPLSWLDLLAVLIWLTGFTFEAVGDWQLSRFLGDPANRGRLMTGGLWRYTRHPNYFGEVTLWWGLWLLTLATPGGWLTIIGPLTITLLILKVSGIPMLEEGFAKHPDFAAYRRRTSAFFPRPPRDGAP